SPMEGAALASAAIPLNTCKQTGRAPAPIGAPRSAPSGGDVSLNLADGASIVLRLRTFLRLGPGRASHPLRWRVVQRNVHARTTALDKGRRQCLPTAELRDTRPSNSASEAASAEDRCGGGYR